MARQVDAVVIGAGLGGLSAAAFLAKKGHQVLLLERHNVPGGYATSFVRGRFEFEVALHELSDIGTDDNPGSLLRYLRRLGIDKKVEFLTIRDLYRSVLPDFDIRLSMGRENYTETLCRAFPSDADGIRRFMARVFTVFDEIDVLSGLAYKRGSKKAVALAKLPFTFRATPRYFFSRWGDVLNRDVRDERARAVLSQLWGYFGIGPAKVSFFYFAVALASYVTYGASFIKGRSQALSNAFVEVIEENGGEVMFCNGAKRILVDKGRAVGVITEADEEVRAKVVVSNADPITTCRELIGLEHIPQTYLKGLRHSEVAGSSFNVYLGLAKPLSDFGYADHETFINRDADLDEHYERMRMIGEPGEVAMTAYNTVSPDVSPPGTSIVVVTALVYGDPWTRLAPEAYVDTKSTIAESMLDLAERVLPGLRDAAEVVEVATPVTNMRYAGTLGGSIYGFDNTPFNHTILRPGPGGALAGLYQVGAWTKPGGGFSPAMFSGQIAGEVINVKLKTRQDG